MKRKSYYDLEVSKERRLWYSEIRRTATTIVLAASIIFSDEDNRKAAKKAYATVKDKVAGVFKH